MAVNPAYRNLGNPVTTREVSWLDQCTRAWGTEWAAPDHRVYNFTGGRSFDSTDKNRTGIYGVILDNAMADFEGAYADMFDPLQVSQTGDFIQFDGVLPYPLQPTP